jgi:DNA-binding winged helix-turn-helix (wHTH) protein
LRFHFADFELDLARHELRRAGELVHVEPQVFDLLAHLIRNRDRIVGKDELNDAVWQGRIVSEATLSSRISAARRALGDSGNDQSLIRTLYKRGFRFVGVVEEGRSAPIEIATVPEGATHDATELVPTGEPLPLTDNAAAIAALPDRDMSPALQGYVAGGLTVATRPAPSVFPPAAAPAPEGLQTSWADAAENGTVLDGQPNAPAQQFAVAGIAIAVLLLVSAWWLWSPSPSSSTHVKDQTALTKESEPSMERLAALPPSIIVLPFINLSGDANQDYIVDGITDSLTSDLARAAGNVRCLPRHRVHL